MPRGQVLQQVVEGEAAVDDVLDHDDVAAAEVDVEVLHDAHHTAGLGGAAVGRHRHEVELDRQVDVAGQVGHEHQRALEHADQQRGTALVVAGDLLAELGEALVEHLLGDDDLTEVRVGVGTEAGTVARSGHGGRSYRTPSGPSAGTNRRRPCDRSTRRPRPTSVAVASPRATARTRSTVAASGGWRSTWSARSHSRTATRATAVGRGAQRPGVGDVERGGLGPEVVGDVGDQVGLAAEHAARGRARRRRRAGAAPRGAPGCGGTPGRRWRGRRPDGGPRPRTGPRSRPGAGRGSGAGGPVGCRRARRGPRPAAGSPAPSRPGRRRCGRGRRRARGPRGGRRGPGPRGWGRARRRRPRPGRRRRSARRRPARRRPPRPSRAAGRGRRARR